MLAPIPNILDYGISATRGFLSPDIPLSRLPSAYYTPWESVISNLQPLILSKRLRSVIDRLPILSTSHLKEEAEWRRAYVILAFLAHSYIWTGLTPAEIVPPPISRPFKTVCAHLELPTVATYAAVCLWNWRPIFDTFSDGDEDVTDASDLSNLASLHTFTGSTDESWFYIVSVAIEARGAQVIPVMLRAISAARENDSATVAACLQIAAEHIDGTGSLLNRMYEECSPETFYNRIRPYLAGSKNMGDAGLPRGVLFDTTGCGEEKGEDQYVQYGGGSNAQSSLIQFFDIVLGVEHRPTGVGPSDEVKSTAPAGAPPTHNFINEMRRYMPGAHRRFLVDVGSVANIRAYVHAHRDDQVLVLAYDACLAMLRALRDKHIQMVSRYIIVQSRGSRSLSPQKPGVTAAPGGPGGPGVKAKLNLANVQKRQGSNGGEKKGPTGTGGTALIPFLKQARDETTEGVVDQWAKRLLGEMPVTSRGNPKGVPVRAQAEEAQPAVGMAGTWSAGDSEGGICHW